MKNECRIDCPHCGNTIEVDSGLDNGEENIWFDTGNEVLLVPREMLKYIEDCQGEIGIT